MAKSYSKRDLEALLTNPNVRKMLDLISYTEGTTKHGYYTTFGGGRQSSLARHENQRKGFKQTDGKSNVSSAAGRYQFIKGTWDSLARQYGLNDFGERNQDIGALALIAQKGQLEKVVAGDFTGAIANLGSVWASLPSSTYKQGKKSWDAVNKFLGSAGGSQAPAPSSTDTTMQGYQPISTATTTTTQQPTQDPYGFDPATYQPQVIDLFGNTYSTAVVQPQPLTTQSLFGGLSANSLFTTPTVQPVVGGLFG